MKPLTRTPNAVTHSFFCVASESKIYRRKEGKREKSDKMAINDKGEERRSERYVLSAQPSANGRAGKRPASSRSARSQPKERKKKRQNREEEQTRR